MTTQADKVARLRRAKDTGETQDLEALLEVAKALHATLEVEALLALVVDKAVALTGADRGCLVTVDEGDAYRVEIACDRSGGRQSPESFRPSSSVLGSALARRAAVVVNDVTDTEFGDKASIREMSIRMVLCAPMFIADRVAGLVYVDSVASREGFSERRLRTLDALAGQAAVAWQQANLFAEKEALLHKVRVLDAGKMNFIEIASHELRTPLTKVRGYVDFLLMMMAEGDCASAVEFGGNIMGGVLQLVEIVDNMLMATRIDAGGFSTSQSPYPLVGLAEQVVEVWRLAARDRDLDIQVVFDGPGEELVWSIDPTRMEVALGHLVQNAIKFTPDGGRVEVRLLPGERAVHIEVADTGIGVEEQYQDVIFEKFYRIGEVRHHSTGKTKFNGAGPGLGLFLVRGIAEAHGGRVWVESDGAGAGSRFIVRLPGGEA